MFAGRLLFPLLVFGLVLGGCSKPQMDDLHMPGGLTGFVFDANSTKARNVFPDREQLRQYGWATFGEDHNSLMITKYAGEATQEDVEAARDAQARRYASDAMRYGEVESLVVDRKPAYGWLETQIYKGKVVSLEYKAVVNGDGVCYAAEFYGGREDYRDAAKLKTAIGKLETGRTKLNTAPITAGVLVLVIGGFTVVGFARKR